MRNVLNYTNLRLQKYENNTTAKENNLMLSYIE